MGRRPEAVDPRHIRGGGAVLIDDGVWWRQFFETKEAIDRLPEPSRPVSRMDVQDWLDGVAAVVQESRARLREIGGGGGDA